MRATGTTMSALRAATADLHARADAELRSGGWLRDAPSYACFAQRLLGFHRVVEAAAAPLAGPVADLDHPARRRSPLLEADLRRLTRLGVPRPPPAHPAVRLHLDDVAALLGCLYVVEGSTLGGQVLIRWVARDLGPDVAAAATHLTPYGDRTYQRWTELAAVIEQLLAGDPAALRRAVAAARATFDLHHALVGSTR
jgi:heme oxygenase